MSFSDYRYEADDGNIYKVRMDDALQAAITANTENAVGDLLDQHVYSKVSDRRFGIHARAIVATRSFGTAPDNGVKRVEIPILDPSNLEGATPAIKPGDTFTYKTFTWTISTIEPETTR